MSPAPRPIPGLFVAAVMLGLLALAWPAAAHSALQSSDPPADQLTTEAVEQLALTFGQPIDVLDDSVRISDPDGQPIVPTAITRQADQVTVLLDLPDPLTSGIHTVTWRVIGADGHPIDGAYQFTVDAAPSPSTPLASATALPEPDAPAAPRVTADPDVAQRPSPDPSTPEPSPPPAQPTETTSADALAGPAAVDPPTPPADGVDSAGGADVVDLVQAGARWVAFAGILLAIGVTVFGIAVHPDSPADQVILTRLLTVGGVLTIIGSLLQLIAHVAVVSGGGLPGAMDAQAWGIVSGGGVFTGTMLRVAAGAGIVAASQAFPDWSHDPSHAWTVAVGAAVLLLSFQFTGHTATSQPALIVRAANAAHVLAAAVWTGGVTALATVELRSLGALFTTGYGRVLLAKLTIVAAIGAVGAYNHTRLVPSVVGGDTEAVARMQRTMRMELSLFPIALVLTAFLVGMSP